MGDVLHTARLLLRPLELADAAQVEPLFAQWDVVRHLNARVPWPYPEGGVLAFYRDLTLPAIERGEEWHWTLRLRQAPETILGVIGVMQGEMNRGFWLAPEWQGRGLMIEAVAAVNDYWFDVLGFRVLRVTKAVANAASRRISERTGMRIVASGEGDFVCGRLASETWEITADEWHEWRERHAPEPDPL